MARPPVVLTVLVVVGLVAAGCADPDRRRVPPEPEWTEPSPPAGTSGADGQARGIVLSGNLTPLGRGFVANVSAYNEGPATYATGRAYCVSAYGSWTAWLSGPPGERLDYRNPATTELSCPGQTGEPMPPGSAVSWTFHGDWSTGQCSLRHVCDNAWDGNLTGEDGERRRAPAGNYTWTFQFQFSAGGSAGTQRVEARTLDLDVVLPP